MRGSERGDELDLPAYSSPWQCLHTNALLKVRPHYDSHRTYTMLECERCPKILASLILTDEGLSVIGDVKEFNAAINDCQVQIWPYYDDVK